MGEMSLKEHVDQRLQSFSEEHSMKFEIIYPAGEKDLPALVETGYDLGEQLPYYTEVDVKTTEDPRKIIPTKDNYKSEKKWKEDLEDFLRDVEIKDRDKFFDRVKEDKVFNYLFYAL